MPEQADDYVALQPGQKFAHGPYFKLDVRQEADGVYPSIRTGDATMVLPWTVVEGAIEVCLLRQERVDTAGESILKVCGGYNGKLSRDEAGLVHLLQKTGHAPGQNGIRWWRQCLGVGPQYQFPIWYGFLKEPRLVSTPTKPGCSSVWMSLDKTCQLATATDTNFFDDFSTAMLLMLLMHWREM